MKEFTVQELADAIRKNGLTQTRSTFFRDKANMAITDIYDMYTIGSACALGQAAINLGITPFKPWKYDSDIKGLGSNIIMWNDVYHYSFEEIATAIEQDYADYLDTLISAAEFDYLEYVNAQV